MAGCAAAPAQPSLDCGAHAAAFALADGRVYALDRQGAAFKSVDLARGLARCETAALGLAEADPGLDAWYAAILEVERPQRVHWAGVQSVPAAPEQVFAQACDRLGFTAPVGLPAQSPTRLFGCEDRQQTVLFLLVSPDGAYVGGPIALTEQIDALADDF